MAKAKVVKKATKAVQKAKPKGLPGVTKRAADPTAALANHWSKHPKLATLTDLPRVVMEYEAARVAAKAAEEKKQELSGALKTMLQLASIPPAVDDENKVTVMGFELFYTREKQGRVSVDKFAAELVKRGCPSDVMEQSRDAARGEPSTTLQLRPVKALDVEGSKQ